MKIDEYLRAADAVRDENELVVRSYPKDGPNDLAYYGFLRQVACGHTWLQAAVSRSCASADPRQEVLCRSSEHAGEVIRGMAFATGDAESFLPQPSEASFGPFTADQPDGWLTLGFSALLLELLLTHADPKFPLLGKGFGLERGYALAEAGRKAKGKKDERVKKAIVGFIPPAEVAWGESFIDSAYAVLKDRIDSRRALLRPAVAALREAPGLPDDPWLYLKPQIERHADRFAIGPATKLTIRGYLKLC